MRTGAASGVATKYLARPEASAVGLYGAGKQARTQLLAVCKARAIKHVASSAATRKITGVCADMAAACQCPVEPATRPEEAAQGQDIVITATDSRTPVLLGDWLSEGVHLNVIGSNFLAKAEVDAGVFRRANNVVVDSKEQARIEAGDFPGRPEEGVCAGLTCTSSDEVIVGRQPGRGRSARHHGVQIARPGFGRCRAASLLVVRAKQAGVGRWIEW